MSSSSSSSQISGVKGRTVEISGNGNGSSCWNSMAAIGELRGTGRMNADGGGGGGHKWSATKCRLMSPKLFSTYATSHNRCATESESASVFRLRLCLRSPQTTAFWRAEVSNQMDVFSFPSAQSFSVFSQSPFAPLASLLQQPARRTWP